MTTKTTQNDKQNDIPKLKWQKIRQKHDKQNDRQNWNDKKNDKKKRQKKWQNKYFDFSNLWLAKIFLNSVVDQSIQCEIVLMFSDAVIKFLPDSHSMI